MKSSSPRTISKDDAQQAGKRKSESPDEAGVIKRRVLPKPVSDMGAKDKPHQPVKTKVVRDPATGLWRREVITEPDKTGDCGIFVGVIELIPPPPLLCFAF